ncbi:MAG: AMP-dependent synthetase/ligase, partial [Acidimicrobiia bacterium]
TIPKLVFDNAEQMPDRPAYHVKVGSAWRATTWATYAGEVRAAAKALVALGVEVGDKVNILGFNRPEWVIMDVAAIAVGAVPAGIYTTNSPHECKYIIGHSEAPLILIEDEGQWDKIVQVRAELPALRTVVLMKGAAVEDEMAMTWEAFLGAGADVPDDVIDSRLGAAKADDIGTLIYTSGTTGPPKAVMLTHDNLTWTPAQVTGHMKIGADDTLVSYLPLSHIAEQSFTIAAAAQRGYAVYFAESIDALAENLKEVQPTIFFAVPRVWERFHAGVTAKLAEATGVKAKLAAWAMDVGRKVNDLRNIGEEPAGLLAIQYKLADTLVFSKVKAALGLGKVRVAATAAAPIAAEILEFFAGLDILIWEIYGQSEDTGPTSVNLPGRTRFGSVGVSYPNVEVKIAEDGEILVKGRNVFKGYYKDAEATAETLVDGWLQSGDLGEFDDDGFLYITGRKKDIIITAGGKNVAPAPIEGGIKNHPLVSEAVVIGDRRKFLSAVVTLDEEAADKFMADEGLAGPAHESEAVAGEIQRAIDAVNENLARVEQIKKFTVLGRQLSIEDGELTPTLKVKRNRVTEHFTSEIEAMYRD